MKLESISVHDMISCLVYSDANVIFLMFLASMFIYIITKLVTLIGKWTNEKKVKNKEHKI